MKLNMAAVTVRCASHALGPFTLSLVSYETAGVPLYKHV